MSGVNVFLAVMQVKLSMRSVPVGNNSPPVPKPFLTFTCRGPNLNMVQDLPISKPHAPARAPSMSPAHPPTSVDNVLRPRQLQRQPPVCSVLQCASIFQTADIWHEAHCQR